MLKDFNLKLAIGTSGLDVHFSWGKEINIHFSDHSAIVADIGTKLNKNKQQKIVSRDMRKLRNHPDTLNWRVLNLGASIHTGTLVVD